MSGYIIDLYTIDTTYMFQRMSHIMYHPIWTGVNYQRKNTTDSQLNFAPRDYKERILFFLPNHNSLAQV